MDVRAAFRKYNYRIPDDSVADKCDDLALITKLSSSELAKELELYLVSRQRFDVKDVTAELLDSLEQELKLKRSMSLETKGSDLAVSKSSARDTEMPDVLGDATNIPQATPARKQSTPAQKPAFSGAKSTPPSSTFQDRSQSGQVIEKASLNLGLVIPPRQQMDPDACKIDVIGPQLRWDQRFMVDRIQDKVKYLEDRMDSFASAYEEATTQDPSGRVDVAMQEPSLFVGRICAAPNARLAETSTFIEGSLKLSEGERTRLDLSKLDSYRVFPGQVVVAWGLNPSGLHLVAQQLVTSIPLPFPSSTAGELAAYREATGESGLSLVVAAGPFAVGQDMSYKPLDELLDYVTQHKPDVVILLGPFVDVDAPTVEDGTLDVTFDAVFEKEVLQRLRRAASQAGGGPQFVLVPSTQDAHADPVFPQPPFRPSYLDQREQGILFVPNPATFSINEVVVGVCGQDVLRDMSGSEIGRGGGDRMAALAAHLLGQRCFYPLFPPPLGACLDTSLARHLRLPCTPDLLILPSDLAAFAKTVPVKSPTAVTPQTLADAPAAPNPAEPSAEPSAPAVQGDVVCVNPGRLSKFTFAHLRVAPSAGQRDAGPGGRIPHCVGERCRVEIRRL